MRERWIAMLAFASAHQFADRGRIAHQVGGPTVGCVEHLVGIDPEPVAAIEHLHRECFVQLPQADVVHFEAEELEQRLKSNKFTLQDFYDQLVQLKSMGSMEELLAQMPGGANLKGVKLDEKAMAHTEAIILSMTPKEREKPEIIAASRKKRIAAGAGVKVEDVNRLLKSFEQMRKMIRQFSGPGMAKKMKRMKGFGGFGGFPGM